MGLKGYLNLALNASRSLTGGMGDERRSSPAPFFLLVALLLVAAGVWFGISRRVPWFFGALAGINVATVLLYGYDKAVAGGRRTRVPETVLHLLALLGGSPAALLGQAVFHHKTVKPSFQRMFWLIVVVQLGGAAGGYWWWKTRGG
jgi:uncharacterized membrane protein YsdA (DUF1294 family)